MASKTPLITKLVRLLISIAILGLIFYLLRVPILRGLGNYLIHEDEPVAVSTMFVLGGNPYERTLEAKKLFEKGMTDEIVCTAEMVPTDFKALGLNYRECDITKKHLLQLGMDPSDVKVLPEGTSTKEEAQAILNYCQANGIDSVMVLSSKFHTRRIHYFFDDKFEEAGIYLNIQGAPSTQYRESRWWKNEYGLLMVNNEYVKLLYYMVN